MAEGGQKQIDAIIQCAICLETLTDPVILPCLHHLCFKCKEDYSKSNKISNENTNSNVSNETIEANDSDRLYESNQNALMPDAISGDSVTDENSAQPYNSCSKAGIHCPICRNFASFDAIKPDFTMQELIVAINNANLKATERTCDFCSNEKPAYRCVECKSDLGTLCKTAHLNTPMCRGHTVKKLEEVSLEDTNIVNKVVFCTKHPDKLIEFNCVDCNTPLCYMCCILDHKSHQHESIPEALDKLVPITEKKLEPVQNDINLLGEAIEKLTTLEAETKEIKCICLEEIENKKSELKKQIDEHAQKLESNVNMAINAKFKEIENQRIDIINLKSTKESIANWTQTVLTHVKNVSLLNELQGDLMTLLEQHQQPAELSDSLVKPTSRQLKLQMYRDNVVGVYQETDKMSSCMVEQIQNAAKENEELKVKMNTLHEEKLKQDSLIKDLNDDFQKKQNMVIQQLEKLQKENGELRLEIDVTCKENKKLKKENGKLDQDKLNQAMSMQRSKMKKETEIQELQQKVGTLRNGLMDEKASVKKLTDKNKKLLETMNNCAYRLMNIYNTTSITPLEDRIRNIAHLLKQ